MHKPAALPDIMVAPNGARRTPKDHPFLPVTHDEIIETAKACQIAGADGIHLHIRDARQAHLLDAAEYQVLLDRIAREVPDLYLQVTSEAAGRYEAADQIAMIKTLKPAHVSVALREMVRGPDEWRVAQDFYEWAADACVDVQHILYTPDDVQTFVTGSESGRIPGNHHLIQFVLGAYDGSQASQPEDIQQLLDPLLADTAHRFDWMLCAFGKEETACLAHAAKLGGKVRVGFENSLWNADGSRARNNAERVAEVVAVIRSERSMQR